ncbi:hypothetical protein O181_020945 [Austropuccinia psidii MF-1]|uniref:Uncharacterized protein n=1 Tax=Austropuccinia psidii MF-1 TaxID=1389203 RepID=A0A9Q3CER6_9BASI|nr:hypothetical protein [Austropuccinia psidii MF-1]
MEESRKLKFSQPPKVNRPLNNASSTSQAKKKELSFFTRTCPSFNKLEPHKPGEKTSLQLLREYFARPEENLASSIRKQAMAKARANYSATIAKQISNPYLSSHERLERQALLANQARACMQRSEFFPKLEKPTEAQSGATKAKDFCKHQFHQ